MRVRRACGADWDAVLALQESNLAWNLKGEDKARGFLSARFSRVQLEAMNAAGAIVTARDDDSLAGYACASTQALNAGVPIIAAMMEAFPRLTFLDRPLESPATAIYGPVCVDRAYRGRGVFRKLVDALKSELSGRFETAVAFIAKSNRHSLAAHVDGLGMSLVGDFRFEARPYWIVAFGVPPEAVSCVPHRPPSAR